MATLYANITETQLFNFRHQCQKHGDFETIDYIDRALEQRDRYALEEVCDRYNACALAEDPAAVLARAPEIW